MRGKGTGRIRSSRQNRKRRVRIRRNGHESLSSLRIQNPVLGGRIASAESSGVDRVLQDWMAKTSVSQTHVSTPAAASPAGHHKRRQRRAVLQVRPRGRDCTHIAMAMTARMSSPCHVCGGRINPTSDRTCRLSVGPYAGRWAHHCALNHLVSLGFIAAEDASNVEI